MAIEPMRLLRLAGSKENIEKILLTAFSSDDMHAELASHVINEGNGGQLMPEDNTYADFYKRIQLIFSNLHSDFTCAYDGISVFSDEEIESHIRLAEVNYEKINEQQLNQSILTKEDKEALIELRKFNIESLNHLSFTAVTFGRLPLSSQAKLTFLADKGFVHQIVFKNNHYVWIFIISNAEDAKINQSVLESLFFEPIPIPKVDEKQLALDCESTIGQIYGYVEHHAEVRRYYKYMAIFDDIAVVTGFVPKKRVKAFKSMFGEMEDVTIQDFPAGLEEGLEPPTILKNNWFAKPFELFIEMYGLPHYGDFDPTFYLAVTYCFLFGIMFGDLGQGFVLSLGGWFLWKRKGSRLASAAIRIGLFSMFFGLVFGSFFGDEHVLDPLYRAIGMAGKPLEVMEPSSTNVLLLGAIAIGATLILSSILINIVLRFKRKQLGEALFSQNGLAGFIFYGSLIGMLTLEMMFQIKVLNIFTEILFLGIPLLMILLREPLTHLVKKVAIKPHGGWGGYLTEAVFELIEVLLSFVSNTMSFLRVGGFVLSHAGMMFVVMTLKDMSGSAGLLVIIIGNIFVMGLEGLIVGIQTLRLQYYEMFSRYYEGGGKKYIPTTTLDH
ncbi:MAG: V-type H+-transporting ATPase subunit I [Erysipelotrichaceae bacterium]|nr:MAG: V-type H+-transporting ATPase subunit [Erysipelotrichaceae bacterium]TXT19734.1 MAG: V-type H+-transporting ATPase subunit I [Erysipelotrichaceae bacterium]